MDLYIYILGSVLGLVVAWQIWIQIQVKMLHTALYKAIQASKVPLKPPASLIKQWENMAKKFPEGTPKGDAYRARLKEIRNTSGD